MSVFFTYEDVSSLDGIITRKIKLGTDTTKQTVHFASFQAEFKFASSEVTIISHTETIVDPNALFAINPTLPAETSASGSVRIAGLSLSGIAPGAKFFEMTYSHPVGTNPQFTVSDVLINEKLVTPAPVATSYEVPNIGGGGAAAATPAYVVQTILGESGGYYLYALKNNQAAISQVLSTAGSDLTASTAVILSQSVGSPLNVAEVISSGLTSFTFAVDSANSNASLTIGLANGSSTLQTYSLTSGLYIASQTLSAATPVESVTPVETSEATAVAAAEAAANTTQQVTIPVTTIVNDGSNVGSGQTDSAGVEVTVSDVDAVFSAASDASVLYRQRLGDAVAIESQNRDGTLTGRIVGDVDSRTVRQITNGTTNMTIDLPSGTGLDLMGLSTPASYSKTTSYFSGIIDSVIPASVLSNAPWNASLKRAVSKASLDLLGNNIDVDIVTPFRQIAGNDEIVFGSSVAGKSLAAVNLSQVNDLVSASGYDSLIAVGPGRLMVSGSGNVGVYGDVFNQELRGGTGSDFLSGGGGQDILTGGDGADSFEIGFSGKTTITDLTTADTLRFDIFGISNIGQLNALIKGVGQGALGLTIDFGDFGVELVGYNSIGQIDSAMVF